MSQVPGFHEMRALAAWTFYTASWDSASSGRAPSGEVFGKKTLVKIRCPEASSTRPGPKGPAGLFLPSLLTSHSNLLHDHAPPKTNSAGTLE